MFLVQDFSIINISGNHQSISLDLFDFLVGDDHQRNVACETTIFSWVWAVVILIQSDCRIRDHHYLWKESSDLSIFFAGRLAPEGKWKLAPETLLWLGLASQWAKDICKMSNNCLVKTARHLAEMRPRCLKDSFFCKSKQCLTKALIRHLKKTSQKCLQDTAKTTHEAVFKISKRQLLFCRSNQCLSKPLCRQLIHTSASCLGRISVCLAISVCLWRISVCHRNCSVKFRVFRVLPFLSFSSKCLPLFRVHIFAYV